MPVRQSWWHRSAPILLSGLVPLVLVLTSVRLLLSETFVRLEYRTPAFPADPYGFTLEDRLRWAPLALAYLLNDSGIEFLADQRFDSGEPLYNARELRHMDDVKRLTRSALGIWNIGLGLAIVLFGVLWGSGARQTAWLALGRGARWTLFGMLLLGVGLALAFSFLFVGFHRLFFEGTTWLFEYTDTLIRLFPERFWRDTFLALVLLTFLGAGLLWAIARRQARSAQG